MSFTNQVLRLMQDGKSYTATELRALADAGADKISNALRNMKKFGYVDIAPSGYSINAVGRSRIVDVSPEVAAARAKQSAKNNRDRAKGLAPALPIKVESEVDTHSLVQTALRSRPALDLAWMGGAHA